MARVSIFSGKGLKVSGYCMSFSFFASSCRLRPFWQKLEAKKGNPISSKDGKTIIDNEDEFLSHFERDLSSHEVFSKKPFRKLFWESVHDQKKYGKLFVDSFAQVDYSPFTRCFLRTLWPGSQKYEDLCKLFCFHPAFAAPFIQAINQNYYTPVLDNWRRTQYISFFSNPSNYYARALPGTREAALDRAQEAASLFIDMRGTLPQPISKFLESWHELFFNKRWDVFAGCLLPYGYRLGEAGYGRLKSIPPSTLCNMKKDVKLAVLRAIKANHGVSFVEVDLKSCHGKIFEDLFHWKGFNWQEFPNLDDLWPTMIQDFWSIADKVSAFPKVKEKVKGWTGSDLKGLLKNQFYKSLNGGMPDFAEDNIDRSRTKLKINESEQPDFNEFFHLVFEQMTVFKILTAFIEQINEGAHLFLPNMTKGFKTETLSKKQAARWKIDDSYNPRKQTGNSRLFSNMELCLILHLYAAIIEADRNWLVVGYEADGVLVAGEFTESEALKQAQVVSYYFKRSIKSLTTAPHEISLKNFV